MFIRFDMIHERDRQTDGQTLHASRGKNHLHRTYTKKLMWQVGDVSIEAGSLIQAGSPIQARGLGHLMATILMIFLRIN